MANRGLSWNFQLPAIVGPIATVWMGHKGHVTMLSAKCRHYVWVQHPVSITFWPAGRSCVKTRHTGTVYTPVTHVSGAVAIVATKKFVPARLPHTALASHCHHIGHTCTALALGLTMVASYHFWSQRCFGMFKTLLRSKCSHYHRTDLALPSHWCTPRGAVYTARNTPNSFHPPEI